MRRPAFLLVAALCGVLAATCKSNPTDGSAPSPTNTVLAPVPTPNELIAEVVLGDPERTWSSLRGALGEDAVLVPRTVGGLAVSLFGLPLRAVQEFDEKLPAFAALAGVEAPHATLALHVHDGGTFVALLTSGTDASFDVEQKDGVSRLTPRATSRGGLVEGAALGVVGNYLVIGNGFDALAALGPFLVRTIAPRHVLAKSTADAPRAEVVLHSEGGALGALLKRSVEARFAATADKPSTTLGPLFELPAALAAFSEALAHAEAIDVTLELPKDRFRLEAFARVAASNETDAPLLGVSTALASLPADTVAAFAFTEARRARTDAVASRATALLTALSTWTKGGTVDEKKLTVALTALSEGRGERTLLGARCSGAGLTGFSVGDVADRAKLQRGVDDLLALRSEGAVTAGLDKSALQLTVESGRLELVTDEVTLLRLAPKKSDASRAPTDLRFAIGESRFAIAAGAETVDTLQALYRPDQAQTLAAHATVRAALAAHEGPASFAAIVDPVALAGCQADKPSPRSMTPITASMGRVPHGMRLRIDMVPAAISVIGRLLR